MTELERTLEIGEALVQQLRQVEAPAVAKGVLDNAVAISELASCFLNVRAQLQHHLTNTLPQAVLVRFIDDLQRSLPDAECLLCIFRVASGRQIAAADSLLGVVADSPSTEVDWPQLASLPYWLVSDRLKKASEAKLRLLFERAIENCPRLAARIVASCIEHGTIEAILPVCTGRELPPSSFESLAGSRGTGPARGALNGLAKASETRLRQASTLMHRIGKLLPADFSAFLIHELLLSMEFEAADVLAKPLIQLESRRGLAPGLYADVVRNLWPLSGVTCLLAKPLEVEPGSAKSGSRLTVEGTLLCDPYDLPWYALLNSWVAHAAFDIPQVQEQLAKVWRPIKAEAIVDRVLGPGCDKVIRQWLSKIMKSPGRIDLPPPDVRTPARLPILSSREVAALFLAARYPDRPEMQIPIDNTIYFYSSSEKTWYAIRDDHMATTSLACYAQEAPRGAAAAKKKSAGNDPISASVATPREYLNRATNVDVHPCWFQTGDRLLADFWRWICTDRRPLTPLPAIPQDFRNGLDIRPGGESDDQSGLRFCRRLTAADNQREQLAEKVIELLADLADLAPTKDDDDLEGYWFELQKAERLLADLNLLIVGADTDEEMEELLAHLAKLEDVYKGLQQRLATLKTFSMMHQTGAQKRPKAVKRHSPSAAEIEQFEALLAKKRAKELAEEAQRLERVESPPPLFSKGAAAAAATAAAAPPLEDDDFTLVQTQPPPPPSALHADGPENQRIWRSLRRALHSDVREAQATYYWHRFERFLADRHTRVIWGRRADLRPEQADALPRGVEAAQLRQLILPRELVLQSPVGRFGHQTVLLGTELILSHFGWRQHARQVSLADLETLLLRALIGHTPGEPRSAVNCYQEGDGRTRLLVRSFLRGTLYTLVLVQRPEELVAITLYPA